ncbi:MAG: hypothetical protein JWN70_3594 [Planctomycetaceae bacterium]|nr:hypothetical protein [Planctomycetaceae bacterium]
MSDSSVTKVQSKSSPRGEMGQKYLASGVNMAMRLWEDEPPAAAKLLSSRDYETIGFVIKGRAELELEGQRILLQPGDSWVVPKGALHSYKVLETFAAVESTSPPAFVHGRDLPPPRTSK